MSNSHDWMTKHYGVQRYFSYNDMVTAFEAGGQMATQEWITFYCYVEKGKPVISKDEPDNFESLSFSKPVLAPSAFIAELSYAVDLKRLKNS